MRLGEQFLTAGKARRAPILPVTFTAVRLDADLTQKTAEVRAVLAFVPEDARVDAERDAFVSLSRQYKDTPVPNGALQDEEAYHILARALRDEGDPRVALVEAGAAELKTALVMPVARELYSKYQAFLEQEFPSDVSAEEIDALVEEAKKKSFSDLLSAFGSVRIRRAFGSLARKLGAPPTLT